ncbi:uncharacterized protein LOC125759608 [Rhipicephalus sanguineus]|uniref:uncharacterized protein LOC125759608 n=1 Tax=Rhipicephalus sanguineus TaxID=34632 RepID=UPI0020C2B6E0|nr:uncharacterized protein LOC125759608 [Rhipicephalus sanguineus]
MRYKPFLFLIQILTFGWITHASTEGHICSSFDLSHGNHRKDSAVKMNENPCCFPELPSLEPPILPADFHVTFRGTSSTENLINSPAWSCSSSGQGGSASATMRYKPFLFLIQILTFGWITHASTEGHICSSFDLSHGNHRKDSAVKMNENPCCFPELPSLEPPILPADFHVTFRGTSSTENLINSPAWSCSSSGQGGSASATMRYKPFLFLIQVSYLPGDKSFKSNNVFLVLLPCPQCLERIVVICLHLLDLLSLCGDVESNPGPKGSSESVRGKESSSENLSDRSLLLEVLAGQKELMKRMDKFDSSQKDITNTLAQFKDRLESLECGLEIYQYAKPRLLLLSCT